MENNKAYAEKIKCIRDYIEKWQQKEQEVVSTGLWYNMSLLDNPVSDDKEWDESTDNYDIFATNQLGIIICGFGHDFGFRRFSNLLEEKKESRPTIIVGVSGDFGPGYENLSAKLIESFDINTQEITKINIDLY
jgi:hypothetical protein